VISEFQVIPSSHKLNITLTNWWINLLVNRISKLEVMGRDNVVRENVLIDCGGKKFLRLS